MAKVTVKVEVNEDLVRHLVDSVVKDCFEYAFDLSQQTVPVDTGDLKRSGSITPITDGYEIRYDSDHAAFIEMGTVNMPAQPFLGPAVQTAVVTRLR
jgi:HK97 gp10 family phage protein